MGTDDDNWTFSAPSAGAAAPSAGAAAPSAGAASPSITDEFGDFSDDDDFQAFDDSNAASASASIADTGTPQLSVRAQVSSASITVGS